jgi:hypothetical protein
VHLKGFGDGMTPVYYLQDALALILPYDTVVWDGDPLKAGGFTALVEVYLAAHPVGIAVAFKPRNAVNAFLHSWQGVISRYPGRVKVVPVDIRTVTDAFGLHDEVAQSCALLPDWARDYYTLGRAAIKVSGSAKAVSLGGGGIAAREAAAGIREGASWTVFAAGRGKKESHASLCDMAAAHPRVVTLIRGKDPDEALAFSGDCQPITRTRQIELRSNSGKKRVATVAVPTPVTLVALLDAARQPFKLKRAAAVRLFVVADGHELGEGDPALGSVAIVAVSTGEDFVAREGPPAAADARDLGKGGEEEEEDAGMKKEKEKGGQDGSEEKGEEEQGLSRRELQNWAKKNGKPWRVNGRSDSADIRRAMAVSSMGKGGGGVEAMARGTGGEAPTRGGGGGSGSGGGEKSSTAAAKLLARSPEEKSVKENSNYPRLRQCLRDVMAWADPGFRFSAVAVTKNFIGSPHVDRHDVTHQYALSLGSFDHKKGGQLCVESDPPGGIHVINTYHRLARVDGRYVHWVRGYGGGSDRFSLIWFSTRPEDATPMDGPVFPDFVPAAVEAEWRERDAAKAAAAAEDGGGGE